MNATGLKPRLRKAQLRVPVTTVIPRRKSP